MPFGIVQHHKRHSLANLTISGQDFPQLESYELKFDLGDKENTEF